MKLSTRLWTSATVMLIALVAYCALLIVGLQTDATTETLRGDIRETIGAANSLLSELKDVETGDRGFLLTGQERFLEPYVAGRDQIPELLRQLHRYADDANPDVQAEVNDLDALVARKLDDAARVIADRQTAGWTLKKELGLIDRGKTDMDAVRGAVTTLVTQSRNRLQTIDAELIRNRTLLIVLTLLGSVVVAVTVVVSTLLALRAFRTQRSGLQRALEETSSKEMPHDLTSLSQGDFAGVAAAFSDMAMRLSSEAAHRDAAERRLKEINADLDLVRRMSDRLPACADEAEFSTVIQNFAPQLTPNQRGALYLVNNSNNVLHAGGAWGGPISSQEQFSPADCWALRRGQEHVSGPDHIEVPCAHVTQDDDRTHWCVPLVAQSETVGLLYLEGKRPLRDLDTVHVLSETIALALVNLRLREKLRSQSVRDPLTGLYNRRYLDETLEIEFARAIRSKGQICAIMLDIDHFKAFNDTFGHEAGDAVLKAVAEVLASSMRRGDVAGRFGGEEFLLIMPGVDGDRAFARADAMRESIAKLDLSHGGRKLGGVTASFGVATFPKDGETSQTLLHAADNALYAAKDAGRNRVIASAPSAY